MIWSPEKREYEVAKYQQRQHRAIGSKIVDVWQEETNQVVLNRGRLMQLFHQLKPWLEKARLAPMATSKGYQVDASYAAKIEALL